jgi:hypothetical protein
MRRALASIVVAAAVVGAARATPPGIVHLVAKPPFPPPLTRLAPTKGQQLELVSTTPREPASSTGLKTVDPPKTAPGLITGQEMTATFSQPGTAFVVYGASYLVAFGPKSLPKYAFFLDSFGFPPKAIAPRAYGPQEVVWARQLGRTLVVQTAHLGYASDSAGRNGYLTGIDLDTGRVTWRSPSLVANARNFVVTRGLIVSGYGFTAEKDWLYIVDPRTGRVRDRLALPSMAEEIAVRGDRIVVRCYDAVVVAKLVGA